MIEEAMKLLKKISFGLPLLLLMFQQQADCTPVSGIVYGYWDLAGSPYYVQGDLLVPTDSLLLIKPGVWVIFEGDYEFVVNGRIEAMGTENDSIYFTTQPGVTWNGFKYISNPDTSGFYYCLFENADNYPGGYGGVFYMYVSDIVVEHSTFQHNRANRGAAMYALWDYVSFRYNVCWDNQVYHCGGAINFATNSNSIVERCVFYDNTSWPNPGGAIYFWDDHGRVVNCTIGQNSSPAVLSINGSTSAFLNCIFWLNGMGEVYGATYCDIQGGWPGTGNINADPLFVNPGGNVYYLQAGSPCIDAGDPNSPPDPDGTRADMGAYYFDQGGGMGNLTLDLEPVNPPIIIPPQGGSFDYTAMLTCDSSGYAIFDAWTELLLPDGQVMGPLFIRPNLFLAPGGSLFRQLQMYVSTWAMPGTYEFRGYLGDSPDSVYAQDSFTFVKQPYGGNPELQEQAAYVVFSGWDLVEKAYMPSIAPNPYGPKGLQLKNSPEPFNPETVFRFDLPQNGRVELQIYDLSGRLVATLLDRELEAGAYHQAWDATGMPSGVYLAKLSTPAGAVTERCLLVK